MIDDTITGLAEIAAETAIEFVGEAAGEAAGFIGDLVSGEEEDKPLEAQRPMIGIDPKDVKP